MYLVLLLICTCSYLEGYRYNDRPFERWSGPYFSEDTEKRAFEGMTHHGNFGDGRHQEEELSGFDPVRLFNPGMMEEESQKRHQTESGPEGRTYITEQPAQSEENLVSPQERLASLVSKPIFDDSESMYTAAFNDNEASRRMQMEVGDEEEKTNTKQENVEHGRQHEKRRNFHSSWRSPRFFSQNNGPRLTKDQLENRKLYQEVQPFIKKSKIAKRSLTNEKRGKGIEAKRSYKTTLVSSRTKKKNKISTISTRNEVSSADNLVPGSTGGEFGTQFSEPYHGSVNNGNNGYSRGEYFGADSVDTQDDVKQFSNVNARNFRLPFIRSIERDGHTEETFGNEHLERFGGNHARHYDQEEIGLPLDNGDSDASINHQQHVFLDHHHSTTEQPNERDHTTYFMDPYSSRAHGLNFGIHGPGDVGYLIGPVETSFGHGINSGNMNSFFGYGHGVGIDFHGQEMPSLSTSAHHSDWTPEQYGKHLDEAMQHYLPAVPAVETTKTAEGGLPEKISPVTFHAPLHPNQQPGIDKKDQDAISSPWERLQTPTYHSQVANRFSASHFPDNEKDGQHDQGGIDDLFGGVFKDGLLVEEKKEQNEVKVKNKKIGARTSRIRPHSKIMQGPGKSKGHLHAKLNLKNVKSEKMYKNGKETKKTKEIKNKTKNTSGKYKNHLKSDKSLKRKSDSSPGNDTAHEVKLLRQEVNYLIKKILKMTSTDAAKKKSHPLPKIEKSEKSVIGIKTNLRSSLISSTSTNKISHGKGKNTKKKNNRKKKNILQPAESPYANLGFVY